MIDTDTPEPDAGPVADPAQLRSEIAKVLVDFRDGALDGIDEAIERVLEVTGRSEQEEAK